MDDQERATKNDLMDRLADVAITSSISRRDFFKQTAKIVIPSITLLGLSSIVTGRTGGASALPDYASQVTTGDLTILFTHDLHSHLESYSTVDPDGTDVRAGGYARLASAIDKERKGNEERVLLLDAGDFSMGTFFHTIRSAKAPELVTMGAMGYDATTFGNHEFEFGTVALANTLNTAKKERPGKLPAIIAANIKLNEKAPDLDAIRRAFASYPVIPYKTVQRGGLKIGIMGLMGKDASVYSQPYVGSLVFWDYLEAARKMVTVLREQEKADMVVILSHCGTWDDKSVSEDEILARSVPGIDVIISGHTHTVLNPYIQSGNTLIVSAGAFGHYLGRLDVAKAADGHFAVRNYRLIPVTPDIPENPGISNMVAQYAKVAGKTYFAAYGYHAGQPLACSSFPLSYPDFTKGPSEKCMSSGLGDLVTDAFRYAVKKAEGEYYQDISLVIEPFGQIRESVGSGLFSVDDAFRLLALGMGQDGKEGYPLVTFWLTGAEIKKLMEIETTIAPNNENARLQISGMRFSYSPKQAPFNRVNTVEVETSIGQLIPLQEEQLYRVGSNWNFVLMFPYLRQVSQGNIDIVLKDKDGHAIHDLNAIRIMYDKHKKMELKEWLALAIYLQSFAADSKNIGNLPVQYRTAQPKITCLL
jgi:5'-nucleotidase/UDP-sugar diphosphatase